jgi:hypothetical protein
MNFYNAWIFEQDCVCDGAPSLKGIPARQSEVEEREVDCLQFLLHLIPFISILLVVFVFIFWLL